MLIPCLTLYTTQKPPYYITFYIFSSYQFKIGNKISLFIVYYVTNYGKYDSYEVIVLGILHWIIFLIEERVKIGFKSVLYHCY